MAWVDPVEEPYKFLVTHSLWNIAVVDNLIALKDPPSFIKNVNEATDFSTSSTSFGTIHGTALAGTINPAKGGDIFFGFQGVVNQTGGATLAVHFDVEVNGTRLATDDGLFTRQVDGRRRHVDFLWATQSLAAGSFVCILMWKVSTSTVTMYAGTVAGVDYHPQYWGRELS